MFCPSIGNVRVPLIVQRNAESTKCCIYLYLHIQACLGLVQLILVASILIGIHVEGECSPKEKDAKNSIR